MLKKLNISALSSAVHGRQKNITQAYECRCYMQLLLRPSPQPCIHKVGNGHRSESIWLRVPPALRTDPHAQSKVYDELDTVIVRYSQISCRFPPNTEYRKFLISHSHVAPTPEPHLSIFRHVLLAHEVPPTPTAY